MKFSYDNPWEPKPFDPAKYKRGDNVTVSDGEFVTTIYYYEDAADPDVFGDGGAYSIIDYEGDLLSDPIDNGVLSGYETPGDIAREMLSDRLWVVVDDACDCHTTAELVAWLLNDWGVDLTTALRQIRDDRLAARKRG